MNQEPRTKNQEPISLFVFFTRAETLISRLIRRITASDLGPNGTTADGWSHCGIGFELSDGTRVYFEALFTGFVGPRPWTDVLTWSVKRAAGRDHCVFTLPITGVTLAEKWAAANVLVGVACYNQLQIVLLWFHQRIGRFIHLHVPQMPGLICSEAVARILAPEYDFTDPQHRIDEITPNYLYRQLKTRLVCDYAEAAGNDTMAAILRRLHA